MKKNFTSLLLTTLTLSTGIATAENIAEQATQQTRLTFAFQACKNFCSDKATRSFDFVKAAPSTSKNLVCSNPKKSLLFTAVAVYAVSEIYLYKKDTSKGFQNTNTYALLSGIRNTWYTFSAWWNKEINELKTNVEGLATKLDNLSETKNFVSKDDLKNYANAESITILQKTVENLNLKLTKLEETQKLFVGNTTYTETVQGLATKQSVTDMSTTVEELKKQINELQETVKGLKSVSQEKINE